MVDTAKYIDSVNYITFSNSASYLDIQQAVAAIENMPRYQQNFLAIQQTLASYYPGEFIRTGDDILVRFKLGTTPSDVQNFATQYNLNSYWQPPTPLTFDEHYHIFKILPVEGIYRPTASS